MFLRKAEQCTAHHVRVLYYKATYELLNLIVMTPLTFANQQNNVKKRTIMLRIKLLNSFYEFISKICVRKLFNMLNLINLNVRIMKYSLNGNYPYCSNYIVGGTNHSKPMAEGEPLCKEIKLLNSFNTCII